MNRPICPPFDAFDVIRVIDMLVKLDVFFYILLLRVHVFETLQHIRAFEQPAARGYQYLEEAKWQRVGVLFGCTVPCLRVDRRSGQHH